MNRFLFLDFEFKNTAEQDYTVVCCHTITCENSTDLQERSFWLYQDPSAREEFKRFILESHAQGYIFCAWVAAAELRSLLSLGVLFDDFNVIDVQLEYKLYANTDAYRSWINESNAKLSAKARAEGKRFPKITGKFSLQAACAVLFSETYDEKEDMRRLILTNTEYSPEEQRDILIYCAKDTRLTKQVFWTIVRYLLGHYPYLKRSYLRSALRRGEYAKATTWVEYFGYPIDTVALKKVADNIEVIERIFITEYSKDIQECFLRTITKKNHTYEEMSFNYATLAKKITSFGLMAKWPLTPSGRPATDMETLEELSGLHPFVKELYSLKRKLACIKYLTNKGEKKDDVLARKKLVTSVSSRNRIHCWVNPFGTTTGRNAPPAANFIFAQSSWQRVLVRPAKGRAIIGFDYRAQEILIAGIVGEDPNILEGYASGDPYMSFARQADLIELRDLNLSPDELRAKYDKARNEIYKPVVLGMNYGLGKDKLALYLGRDRSETDKYYYAHKRVYKEYWKNTQKFITDMQRTGMFYPLAEDWGIYESHEFRTLVNWRIQGWGAAVLRALTIEFTKPCYRKRNVNIITLLHDAIYLEVDADVAEAVSQEVIKKMIQIFHDLLPCDVFIDVEYKIHSADDFWVEKKAKETWEIIKPYII